MAQEDQVAQNCISDCGDGGDNNNNNTIVRSSNSKKQKPKKMPQRGLGVAQLERIRIEEQQNKDASLPSAKPKSSSSSGLQNIQIPKSSNSSSTPTGHGGTTTTTINSTPLSHNSNVPLGWPSSTVPFLHGINVPKLFNSSSTCDFSLEKENSGGNLGGRSFRPDLNNLLPFETIPVWPHPGLMQKPQQFQHHPSSSSSSSSSMVYESASAATTSSSSSVLNFQILEPPSSQSYHSNNYPLMWSQEEKMVGIKRPYPFSLDHPPPAAFSSLHYKIPSIDYVHPRASRSEDSASCGNKVSREGSSGSTLMLESIISRKSMKENGGYLSLALPTTSTSSLHQGSKLKHPPHFLPFNTTRDDQCPEFESLPPYHQASMEDQTRRRAQNQRPTYYSFFPQSMSQTGQATSTMKNCGNGEVVESVDLNLKL